MSEERRIKLAKAMGAKCLDGVWHWKGSTWDSLIFDPFTDANDDYAVLEWAYGQGEVFALKFAKHLKNIWRYQIGDYARSALKEQEDD